MSETDTQAETNGILTLEMRDNPFLSLMNRINRLLDTGLREDLQQAFELTRSAVLDGLFTDTPEGGKLAEKLASIIELIHIDRLLGRAFVSSVLDVRPGLSTAFNAAPAPAPVSPLQF